MLLNLNGHRKGAFAGWLARIKGEPRVAWYPSAGEDFRDLLYLHPGFPAMRPAEGRDPAPPDIFLHTDYFPWSTSRFLDNPLIHDDGRTSVTVTSIEELPRLDLPLDARIVDFPEGGRATGRVLFLEVEVVSDRMGRFAAPVLYVFAENAAFCAQRLLPLGGRTSHVIHVRYGKGFGGGKSSGVWLLNILRRVGCGVFISDGHHTTQSGDRRVYDLYPELAGDGSEEGLESIRVVDSKGWSDHGDVSWNIVHDREERHGDGVRLDRAGSGRRPQDCPLPAP